MPSAGVRRLGGVRPRPVQNRTAAELHRIAEDSMAEVGRRITSPP